MEVKDVLNEPLLAPDAAPPEKNTNLQKSAATLSQARVSNAPAEPVTVSIDKRERSSSSTDIRAKLNDIIAIVNVASDATKEISKLASSLDGIIEQVHSGNPPENRRVALEGEANQLVKAIRDQVLKAAPDGIKPLAGDEVRFDIEDKISKTLEVILPDNSKDNFGINQISFSPKEASIQTRHTVALARARIEDLAKAVEETKTQVEGTASALDVAIQNSESSKTSIRDVDEALKLAGDTKLTIGANPEKALKSVGKFDQNVLDLLRS